MTPFDLNSNYYVICHNFHAIYCRNMHDLDIDLWMKSRSNTLRSIESQYMTCYLMAIIIFTLSVNISKTFIVQIYMTLKYTWPWTLEWVKVKCKYAKRLPIHDLLFDGNSNFSVSLTVSKIFIVKCAWPWPWPLKWAKVKGSWNVVYDFLFVINSNFYHSCHCWRDIHIFTL